MKTDSVHARATVRLNRAAWFATVAGMCGSLVSIGLARFAYTPLIPPLIQAHWFSPANTVSLGAANFAGYLAGALLARLIASALSSRQALRLLMFVATAAFFACAYPLSVAWFFVWRFASGLSGGAIMVLVPTSILPQIPAAKRGFVSGMIFLGLGLGIAASGTLIPKLLRLGLRETWFGLGILSLLLTVVSWFGWPADNPPAPRSETSNDVFFEVSFRSKISLAILYGQYAANALGLVPVMLLLVDYIARGLGHGGDIGAAYWGVYGIAAIVGPVICGCAADKIGFRLSFRAALLLQGIAVGILSVAKNLVAVGIATVLLGIFTTGVVPLSLGRIHDILPHSHAAQRTAWSRATIAFAVFQVLGGYGYAFLFSHSKENYGLLFLCGAIALVMALVVDLFVREGGSPAADLSHPSSLVMSEKKSVVE
jgi:predicted MFS family arabinose efflux permease